MEGEGSGTLFGALFGPPGARPPEARGTMSSHCHCCPALHVKRNFSKRPHRGAQQHHDTRDLRNRGLASLSWLSGHTDRSVFCGINRQTDDFFSCPSVQEVERLHQSSRFSRSINSACSRKMSFEMRFGFLKVHGLISRLRLSILQQGIGLVNCETAGNGWFCVSFRKTTARSSTSLLVLVEGCCSHGSRRCRFPRSPRTARC